MLIELSIQKIIRQIRSDGKRPELSQQFLQSTADNSGESNEEDSSITPTLTSSIFEITKSHVQTHQQKVRKLIQKLQHLLSKLRRICSDTFQSDKIVRMCGSVVKVIKTFNLISNPKQLQKFTLQIGQLRRLLRINRIFSYFKEILPLLQKSKRHWLDYYNLFFKNLQFVLDTNDMIGYLQQTKLISTSMFQPTQIKRNTANMYFIECLMWLFLNLYDYLKNRHKRCSQDNLKKKLAILKYFLDSFTSHNDFSKRLVTYSPKTITCIGALSSAVGLYAVWI